MLDVTRLIWRRWRGRHPTGIDRVGLAYLRHFGDRAQAVVQHRHFRRILDPQASRELFALLDEPTSLAARLAGGLFRHFRGLNCRGLGRPYLNVGHTGLDSPGFREWCARADVRPIYLVHDLIPISHPQFCRAGEAIRHRARIRTILSTAHGVIGNSRATLGELEAFANAESLPIPPSVAAWLGSDPLPTPTGVSEPDRPTFVTVGTIEARKNHWMLLEIWSRLIDRLGTAAPRLLIIGQRGWEADRVFGLLDGSEKLRHHVVELNDCSDEELSRHLATACAMLFPSLAEGYGLPLVEALGIGVPVIASDLPVFREIGGDVPDYLDPLDNAGWEAAVLDYAKPGSRARAAQVQRMRDFHSPRWENHFRRVEAWLEGLA